jgi:stage IV sporulation protein B
MDRLTHKKNIGAVAPVKIKLAKHLLFWFIFSLVLFGVFTTWQLQLNAVDNIRILEGGSHSVNLKLPFLYVRGDRDDVILFNGAALTNESRRVNLPISVEGKALGEVNLEFSLFGRIPLRQITINVLPEISLVPGGHSIGIKLYSQGVSVVGFYYFNADGRSISPARDAGVKVGDTLLQINGAPTEDVGHAARLLEKAGREPVTLLLNRDGKEFTVTFNPVYSAADGGYRIGLYIRDSAAGVGTLSFYDPPTGRYGALGHIILDSDTNKPINLSEGTIVTAKIVNIKAAQRGQPGEKTGVFMEYNGFNGNIEKNTPFGIFGRIEHFPPAHTPYPGPIPMALASQVEAGPAEILTVLEGETIGRYAVEIERLAYQTRPSDKGIIVRVVDEELLRSCGGIVQGMSGSPIIQNGRLVGAITHVFINDPTRGYGIFMEWMYQEAEILANN